MTPKALTTIFTGCFILIFACNGVFGETQWKLINYSYALTEYYATYCTTIGDKQIDEAYIVLHPDLYSLHEKDEAARKLDRERTTQEINTAVAALNKGTHDYDLFMHMQLGDYDREKEGFKCAVANKTSCLDLSPLKQNIDASSPEGRSQEVIAAGLVFNRVNKIKLFFDNPEEYNFLKFPSQKAAAFLKNRTDGSGTVNKEVYIVIKIAILPGNNEENKKKLSGLLQGLEIQEMESNYFMLGKIKEVAVYDDMNFKDKLGDVEHYYRMLEMPKPAQN